MYREILNKVKPEIDKTMNFLNRELSKIRTGRVSSSLVEDVLIDSYGGKNPLKQVATISSSGPRTILIQPWDKTILLNIEKSILSSGLGINPIVEGDSVRLVFPPPTEEYRKSLAKTLNDKLEVARVTLRRWREDAWRQIQDGFRPGKIREDDKFRAKNELQELVDEYNRQIEEKGAQKTKEIME
ncbi:MAG: ribosome recycling factor, ribosome recycling factor [Parcubacteria group bacterium GW2011_GWC1_38_6]|nr:MAG: ribosome recycling factor, ribosome recycling factor [Parcubacteria group bacterium GW2011_GWC1_38_6]